VVAVLFARSDSIYKSLPECDVFDEERDARTYQGEGPVVAHPPCRAWGRLRMQAKPRPGEKELAHFAVNQVRRCGGVLEHPMYSTLWKAAGLPLPGCVDEFSGWTLPVFQCWWGHKAQKATWLYICGVNPGCMPVMPLNLAEPTHVVAKSKKRRDRPELSKKSREATPVEFAKWLCEVARLTA